MMNQTPPPPPPEMMLMQLASGYWGSAALGAAVQCGLFDALSHGPRNAEQIAADRGTDVRLTAALADALTGLGLLTKTSDQYAVKEALAELLTPGGAKDLLPALRFNLDLYPLWGRLGEAVKSGQPVVPQGAHLGDDAARTRRFVEGMHSRALALGPMILAGVDVKDCGRLLDVGAGPGTFGRQLAASHERLRVTLLDLPGVIAVARKLTPPEMGRAAGGRIDFVEADYRRDALPGGFDAVLYCGALHQESDESAVALMRKMYGALEAGGRCFVVDLMFEDDGVSPGFAGLFALNMMLFNPRARVFTTKRVQELMIEAGFAEVWSGRLPGSAYATVKGIKS